MEIAAVAVRNIPTIEWDNTANVPREVADFINDCIGLCSMCHNRYSATRKIHKVRGNNVPTWNCDLCR